MLRSRITSVLVLLSVLLPQTSLAADCTLYVLQHQDNTLFLEPLTIAVQETQVLPLTPESGNITLIMPFGLGKSGEVAQRARQPQMGIVRCTPEALQVTYRWANGRERALPEVRLADWATYDMRINVTAFDGTEEAFWIRAGHEVTRAEGPVLDMFGGQVPLQTGDYALTTEVTNHVQPSLVYGSAPLVFDGAHLFVEATLPGQPPQTWIIDIGATGSVIAASALPNGTEVRRVESIEYSPSGSHTQAGTLEGLGGTIAGFQGRAVLPALTVGSVRFDSLGVSVLDRLPNIGGRNPIGILGLDALSRTNVLTIAYQDEIPAITWKTSSATQPTVEVPFSLAYGHLFVKGSIHEQPISILVDTGARLSFLSPSLVEAAGLTPDANQTQRIAGLDGTPRTVEAVPDVSLKLGQEQPITAMFYSGALPVFASMGLQDNGVLLGNDWLGTFHRLELDFRERLLRLER